MSRDLLHDTGQVSTDSTEAGRVLQRTHPQADHHQARLDPAGADSKKNSTYGPFGRCYAALCSIGSTGAHHTRHPGRDGPCRPLGSRPGMPRPVRKDEPRQPDTSKTAITLVGRSRTISSPGTALRWPYSTARSCPMYRAASAVEVLSNSAGSSDSS